MDLHEPWLIEGPLVAERLGSDPATGLSAAEAARRLARDGSNTLEEGGRVPGWRKLVAQFADPLVYLLMAAVAISLVVWSIEGADEVPFEAIVIAVIVVANAVLGYIQEARAEHAVAALRRVAAVTSRVMRDGVERRIPTAELVVGDVVLLEEGDAISADGRVIESATLTVAEAALTGESEPVPKDPAPLAGAVSLGDRRNMVFAGTSVSRGRGRAVVTATGMGSEMGRIAHLLATTEEEPTPLQREIRSLGRMLGVGVLVVAAVVMGAILASSPIDGPSELVDVLLVGVSLAVAAVPEGLPAILSVVLALGVQRMARRNAIVKELSSVETLGSATVICSDKTGTLTRNEMTIRRVVTSSGEVEVTGSGSTPSGELRDGDGLLRGGPLHDEVRAVLSGGSLANDASLLREGEEWVVHGDPTEAAFLIAECKAGFEGDRRERYRRVAEVPFTSERKLMSTVQVDAARDGTLAIATKGAPDVLLDRCTEEQVGSGTRPLDDRRRAEILATLDELAGQAFRTLGVAHRRLPEATVASVDEGMEEGLVFSGLVGILDPPRREALDAIEEAHRAGVRVVMITGDHPLTAVCMARELGIVGDDARAVTGSELDGLDDDALRRLVRQVSVYARVAPVHKLRIVDALQADGNVVAMTGDGVNDAPALKSADIGVAMGITGTDVSKEAARMILADDNFATIVAAVREGRAIFTNIRKFLRYLLSSNAGEVLTMLLGVIGAGAIGLDIAGDGVAVPLLATQILWINLLTDTGPALAMGVDPPPDDVMSRPPRRMTERVIDPEMAAGVLFVGAVMAIATLLALDIRLPGGLVEGSGSLEEARTVAFTTLVIAQLYNCFNARSDRVSAFHHLFTNPLLWAAIALSLALQAAVVHLPVLNRAFGTAPLGAGDWLLAAGMASSVLWADELRKRAGRWRRPGRISRRAEA